MSKTIINKAQLDSAIWTNENLVAGNNISITQIQKPEIDDNTIALFHFDGDLTNSGNTQVDINDSILDVSHNDMSGKFTGTTYARLDSRADFTIGIIIGGCNIGYNDFTMDFWAKVFAPLRWASDCYEYNTSKIYTIGLVNTSTTNAIPSLQVGFRWEEAENGAPVVFIKDDWSVSDTVYRKVLAQNQWVHIAFERINGTAYIYVDGILAYSRPYAYDIGADGDNMRNLLSHYSYMNYQAIGISELRVSNVARYNGQSFTPFDTPYVVAGGSAQYQINATTSVAPIVQTYSNNTGTTLATGLTLANYSTIMIYKNGMLLSETKDDSDSAAHDYTISINDIVFTTALESNDTITIFAI